MDAPPPTSTTASAGPAVAARDAAYKFEADNPFATAEEGGPSPQELIEAGNDALREGIAISSCPHSGCSTPASRRLRHDSLHPCMGRGCGKKAPW